MARGKYLSLEEARKSGQLDRFCMEHPSNGDKDLFERLLDVMARRKGTEPTDKES